MKYFLRSDILDVIGEGCGECPHYRSYEAQGLEPGESECRDGDFGRDYPCKAILAEIKRRLCAGGLNAYPGYIAQGEECQKISEAEGVNYGVSWDEHEYWYVPYNSKTPIGYDSLEEVWKEVFVE